MWEVLVSNLQEVADATGLSLGGVKKICSKLQEHGLLERKGSKKAGRVMRMKDNELILLET